jgi:hypothetical protein
MSEKPEPTEKPDVNQTGADVAVAAGLGILGLLPYASSIRAEIVGTTIPNQRIDRIARFAEILDRKLGEPDKEVLEQKMRTEEFIDLFEEVAFQAARALTDGRREHIAALLENSLSGEDLDHLQEKQLLSLLGQLNDAELIILKYLGLDLDPRGSRAFFDEHQETIMRPMVFAGSPQQDVDRSAVHATYREHLRRLGLLRATYKKPKKDELPEWDLKTGMLKASSDEITPLGRLLLRYIDAEVAPDAGQEEQALVALWRAVCRGCTPCCSGFPYVMIIGTVREGGPRSALSDP